MRRKNNNSTICDLKKQFHIVFVTRFEICFYVPELCVFRDAMVWQRHSKTQKENKQSDTKYQYNRFVLSHLIDCVPIINNIILYNNPLNPIIIMP